MLQLEILILELGAIDRLAACAVESGEVAALRHEVRNDAMENGVSEMNGLAGKLRLSFFSRTQLPEILRSQRHHVLEELKLNAAGRFLVDLNVKINPWV